MATKVCRMNTSLILCKRYIRKWSWPDSRYSQNVLGGNEEDHEKSRDNRSLGQDLNLGTLDYGAGIPTTLPRLSIIIMIDNNFR